MTNNKIGTKYKPKKTTNNKRKEVKKKAWML